MTSTAPFSTPPAPRAGLPAQTAALLPFAALVLAGGLFAVAGDRILFHAINALGGAAAFLWSGLSVAGLGLSALIFAAFGARTLPRVMAGALWCLVTVGGFTHLIKRMLHLPRPLAMLPPDQIHVIGTPLHALAMPSGHAASAFALATLFITAGPGWCRRAPGAAIVLGFAAAIGVARIAVGAHWPSDVLVGSVIGWLGAVIALKLADSSGLARLLTRAPAPLAIGAAQIVGGVAMCALNTGYPQGHWMQWTLGIAACLHGVMRLSGLGGGIAGRRLRDGAS